MTGQPDREQFMRDVRASMRIANPNQALLHRLEGYGARAFEVIDALMKTGQLSDLEEQHALRRLVLLTRHHCRDRKADVLRCVAVHLTHDSIAVRSNAVAVGLPGLHILDTLSRGRGFATTPAEVSILRETFRRALLVALERGLDTLQESQAMAFLAGAESRP